MFYLIKWLLYASAKCRGSLLPETLIYSSELNTLSLRPLVQVDGGWNMLSFLHVFADGFTCIRSLCACVFVDVIYDRVVVVMRPRL
jgi:hypothetical protein